MVWNTHHNKGATGDGHSLDYIQVDDIGNKKINKMENTICLIYAKEDINKIQEIYLSLKETGLDPWMDEPPPPFELRGIPPGAHWDLYIRHKLKESSHILAFLSKTSVQKKGYIQKEYRMALEHQSLQPEKEIFLIPILLDDCKPPKYKIDNICFGDLQWYKLYKHNQNLLIEYLRERIYGDKGSITHSMFMDYKQKQKNKPYGLGIYSIKDKKIFPSNITYTDIDRKQNLIINALLEAIENANRFVYIMGAAVQKFPLIFKKCVKTLINVSYSTNKYIQIKAVVLNNKHIDNKNFIDTIKKDIEKIKQTQEKFYEKAELRIYEKVRKENKDCLSSFFLLITDKQAFVNPLDDINNTQLICVSNPDPNNLYKRYLKDFELFFKKSKLV